ncbi:DUF262 domain-containing protein [Shewanella baltica]|uniref:DUF262 domain-containing protein n=1 Tax=Shewanella baltica TaxID=62322 RepID=UPI003D06808B
MLKWNSSPHPISDMRDWNELHRLEINPEFQRGSVWSDAAKVMLIDSILNEIPMPKILVSKKIVNGSTHRIIIDGQQRTKTILSFLNNEFKLKPPYQGDMLDKYFEDFSEAEKDKFLSYQIDFNESKGLTEQELRNVYSRLNKYTFALNKQELRRADFPGDFLTLSEDLASIDDFDDMRLFTAANRRRLNDIEYVSEILSALIDGPQDKKNNLDRFYLEYTDWRDKDEIKIRFQKAIENIKIIFDDSITIAKTRFKQKSDFYSLILAVDDFLSRGCEINYRNLDAVRKDLKIMNENVSPNSDVRFYNLYAEKCLASANTLASRTWRVNFISMVLNPLYSNEAVSTEKIKAMISIFCELPQSDEYYRSPVCVKCSEDPSDAKGEVYIAWKSTDAPTLSNFFWKHRGCIDADENFFEHDDLYDTPENIKELSGMI